MTQETDVLSETYDWAVNVLKNDSKRLGAFDIKLMSYLQGAHKSQAGAGGKMKYVIICKYKKNIYRVAYSIKLKLSIYTT